MTRNQKEIIQDTIAKMECESDKSLPSFKNTVKTVRGLNRKISLLTHRLKMEETKIPEELAGQLEFIRKDIDKQIKDLSKEKMGNLKFLFLTAFPNAIWFQCFSREGTLNHFSAYLGENEQISFPFFGTDIYPTERYSKSLIPQELRELMYEILAFLEGRVRFFVFEVPPESIPSLHIQRLITARIDADIFDKDFIIGAFEGCRSRTKVINPKDVIDGLSNRSFASPSPVSTQKKNLLGKNIPLA